MKVERDSRSQFTNETEKTSLEKLLFREAIFVKLRLKGVVKIH